MQNKPSVSRQDTNREAHLQSACGDNPGAEIVWVRAKARKPATAGVPHAATAANHR